MILDLTLITRLQQHMNCLLFSVQFAPLAADVQFKLMQVQEASNQVRDAAQNSLSVWLSFALVFEGYALETTIHCYEVCYGGWKRCERYFR